MSSQPDTQLPVTVRVFTRRFSATPRGARLARRCALQQLGDWDAPCEAAGAIVAELAANAVTHGLVPGRDFELVLALTAHDTLAIEVTDTRPDRRPPVNPVEPGPDSERGRGLLLVDALATRWGVIDRRDGGPGKTVRAELDL